MWTCPECQRKFKTRNQSHTCVKKDIGELFIDRPDHLVLAFDKLRTLVMHWQPNSVGASRHAIVFANHKAWLIVKPMRNELDVKFYNEERIPSPLLKKVTYAYGKYAHHVRVSDAEQISDELLELLRIGYDYALED